MANKNAGRPRKSADQKRNCKLGSPWCTRRELADFSRMAKESDLDISMWARLNLIAVVKRTMNGAPA